MTIATTRLWISQLVGLSVRTNRSEVMSLESSVIPGNAGAKELGRQLRGLVMETMRSKWLML